MSASSRLMDAERFGWQTYAQRPSLGIRLGAGSAYSHRPPECRPAYFVMVKFFLLVVAPPEVVILIAPVVAPVGTVTVTALSETTSNSVAATAPNIPPAADAIELMRWRVHNWFSVGVRSRRAVSDEVRGKSRSSK